MRGTDFLGWPFFEERHRRLARDLEAFEIRALRIYEGTSEIQKLVIAGAVLEEAA